MSEGNAPSTRPMTCTRVPLQALGRVHGAEGQVVLVEVRRAGQVAAGGRRVEGQPGDVLGQGGRRGGRGDEPVQVAEPGRVVGVAAGQQRPQHRQHGARRGRRWSALSRAAVSPVRVAPSLTRAAAGAAATASACRSSAWAVAGSQHGEQARGRGPGRCRRAGAAAGTRRSHRPVVQQPQPGEEVFDVRGFQELQPAELHERHPPRGQLHLEQVAVVPGAHQHRLIPQPPPSLDGPPARRRRPGGLRRARRSSGPAAAAGHPGDPSAAAARARRGAGTHRVGQVKQRLAGAEVAFQAYHRHAGQGGGQIGEMGGVRAAEPVDGLRVIADHGQPGPVRVAAAGRCRPGPG